MRNKQKKNENFNFLLFQVLNPIDLLHFSNNPFPVGLATETRWNTEMTRARRVEGPTRVTITSLRRRIFNKKKTVHPLASLALFQRRLPTRRYITSHTNCPRSHQMSAEFLLISRVHTSHQQPIILLFYARFSCCCCKKMDINKG